jgi:hypothetical protein
VLGLLAARCDGAAITVLGGQLPCPPSLSSTQKGSSMKRQLVISAALVLFGIAPAFAKDRPVTDEEKTKLVAAVAEQSCEDGKMEYDIDDGHYEVDDARCSDGQKYDLKFDTSSKLIKKELDD